MADAYAADWESKVAFMRDRVLVRATWSEDGKLLSAETAPIAAPVDEEATQRTSSPAESEQRRREERRRVAALASGGPLRKLADD